MSEVRAILAEHELIIARLEKRQLEERLAKVIEALTANKGLRDIIGDALAAARGRP